MNLRDSEPVRLSGYTALAVGLALLAIIGWSQGLDARAIVGQLAVVALTSIGGTEFARRSVWPEASVKVREHQARVQALTSRDDGAFSINAAIELLVVAILVVVLVKLLVGL